MAKKNEATETNTEVETTATAAPAQVVADERYRKVKDPETGEIVNRKDFILKCWTEKKMSRGAIAKQLTEMNSVENGGSGKKVPYQIVFASTKGVAGGPDKPTEVATPEQPTA